MSQSINLRWERGDIHTYQHASINQSPLMLNYRVVRVKESQVYYIIKYIKKQKNVKRKLMHDLASQ